jgi:hypothetical protein
VLFIAALKTLASQPKAGIRAWGNKTQIRVLKGNIHSAQAKDQIMGTAFQFLAGGFKLCSNIDLQLALR